MRLPGKWSGRSVLRRRTLDHTLFSAPRRPGSLSAVLDDADIARALEGLPGWSRRGDALVREYLIPGGFSDAVAFVERIARAADQADHHPDVTISWNRVTLSWSTHSEGGITHRDVAMAGRSDAIAGGAV